MSIISSGKSVLAKPFIALLLLTILFSLTVFLPRIFHPSLKNNFSPIRGGLSIQYKLLENKSTLTINITNNYGEKVFIINISICRSTHQLNTEIKPGESKFFTIKMPREKNNCLLRIIYEYKGSQRIIYRLVSG
ncbi:hypothetical protein [Staphylothermus hellenicus]|uniref:DUF1616 domain-containing protein n=1 Tax=Staphylothermus hellenicus (strain DSM 12710 / JCM 10830 / BK20S6-10-b1 / P8) TaxID=591019 RepID=D7D8G7_STAHD|nr:hypothetical protein [Staphylothermus hellenicus]ADI32063.1 hypothetical protein Shell_0957 [Staphylothermus hellenicus DSM 12710]